MAAAAALGQVGVAELELPAEAEEALAVSPAQIRERLARDLGDGYANLVQTLKEAMGRAEKDQWLACRDCGAKRVYAAPDYRTRLEAASKWTELGLGRMREQPAAAPAGLGDLDLGRPVEELSTAELEALLLSWYLDDPERVAEERRRREAVAAAVGGGSSVEAAAVAGAEAAGLDLDALRVAVGGRVLA